MAIELRTFASGDTDYISKLNANISTLTQAITSLQAQMDALNVGGGDASVGVFLGAVFNYADALVGPSSYKPTQSASTVSVAPGGMYIQSVMKVVQSLTSVSLSFAGQADDTYYIVVDGTGFPARRTTPDAGTIYSIRWSGSSFLGIPVRICPIFFDTAESTAARISAALDEEYPTLDERLEAGEETAIEAKEDAAQALAVAYELEAALGGGAKIRKIGITVDGTTGVKGAIQIDFNGTIIGWSCIADAVGDLQVEVSTKASSEPPAAPVVPNPVTDKISASAPIQLSSVKSAARDEAGVSTWYTPVTMWDVVQFNTIAVATITRATLYLRIQEDIPSPPVIEPFFS